MKKILLCLFVLLSIFAFGCKKDEETFIVKFIDICVYIIGGFALIGFTGCLLYGLFKG